MNDIKRWSLIYDRDGYKFSLPLLCTLEEAEFHADSLGLNEPQEVIEVIPQFERILN